MSARFEDSPGALGAGFERLLVAIDDFLRHVEYGRVMPLTGNVPGQEALRNQGPLKSRMYTRIPEKARIVLRVVRRVRYW